MDGFCDCGDRRIGETGLDDSDGINACFVSAQWGRVVDEITGHSLDDSHSSDRPAIAVLV